MMNVGVPRMWGCHVAHPGGNQVTGDLHDDGSVGDAEDEVGLEALSAAEQSLLDAALEFYGASSGVIDMAGPERPQLRQDAAGFQAVRRAMGTLEDRVRDARDAGVTPERIAQVARIDREMVELILQRDPTAAPGSSSSDG
jgi:hypothetical protein